MRIFDCFMFYNELDLLEIRFHELAGAVDHFVIVESREMYDLTPKPLYYGDNRSRFGGFNDRVIHVAFDKLKTEGLGHELERRAIWQQNRIMDGLKTAEDNDIVLIGDGDEIARRSVVERMRGDWQPSFAAWPFRPLHQPFYLFYVNWLWTRRWAGTVALPYKYLRDVMKTPRAVRRGRLKHGTPTNDAGWHFSQTGGVGDWLKRMRSNYHPYARREDVMNPKWMASRIARGYSWGGTRRCQRVELDGYFPPHLVEHQDRFKVLIGGDPIDD